jgi:hypothetical protein
VTELQAARRDRRSPEPLLTRLINRGGGDGVTQVPPTAGFPVCNIWKTNGILHLSKSVGGREIDIGDSPPLAPPYEGGEDALRAAVEADKEMGRQGDKEMGRQGDDVA